MTTTNEGRRVERVRAELTEEPIEEQERTTWVRSDSAGAIATFVGVVRDHDHGRSVVGLEYEAHPTAAALLQTAADETASAHGDIESIVVAHRIGALHIGETALLASVASAHRREAFAACADLVERVKATVPIWKRQIYADGSSDWVGCP